MFATINITVLKPSLSQEYNFGIITQNFCLKLEISFFLDRSRIFLNSEILIFFQNFPKLKFNKYSNTEVFAYNVIVYNRYSMIFGYGVNYRAIMFTVVC